MCKQETLGTAGKGKISCFSSTSWFTHKYLRIRTEISLFMAKDVTSAYSMPWIFLASYSVPSFPHHDIDRDTIILLEFFP